MNNSRVFFKINKTLRLPLFLLTAFLLADVSAQAQKAKQDKPLPPVSVSKGGKLVYGADAQGNRIPDFSYCGYMAGNEAIPDVAIKVVVPVKQGDATLRIQSAIDYVSSLPIDKNGFRGAVLLEKGKYEVSGNLTIRASGVILRGSGMDENGTILAGTGTDRATLIRIVGKNDRKTGSYVKITDPYVPVNAMKFQIENAGTFKAGEHILIHRPSTKEWINELGTETFGGDLSALGWKPGERDIYWDRRIVSVNGKTITLDAPLTTALDTKYGGGTVAGYQWPGRISKIGVENLTLQSSYDAKNPKDEAHRWMAITVENTSDAWIRQIIFRHFAGSAVDVLETANRVTVEDCKSLAPVSEIGGQRRNTFITSGGQTLFQRLYSEYGYHDFAVGYCAPGPNAFVQCQAHLPYSFSGTINSWASGVLFDVVDIDGNALRYGNRGQDGQGAGWSAANSVFWQCSAARVDCYQPPTAQNWAFGIWAQFAGDGYWESSNEHIQPRSLYYAQLSNRLGDQVLQRAQLLDIGTEASSSPTVEQAAELTAEAAKPHIQLPEWIDQAAQRQPIPVNYAKVKTIDQIGYTKPVAATKGEPMHIENGWLVRGNSVLTGGRHQVPWWNGTVQPNDLKKAKPAVTRFVPGRIGTGLTDDLNEVTDWMKQQHIVALEQNYGLWYDRRRDDHERVRRMNGDVWPPFYELPFARIGQDIAWDGLSKYDLTKYNTWYWSRLKQFADLADQKGLVLIHHNYFQHNIIEAGAHYVDFPWRTANNINHTGFPEPPPFAGDKRIFLADQFYDVSNPVRRKLHEAFIRQCLDNFVSNTGVIQFIGEEFTGPLHFVQFWVDTILGWEKETGKSEMIGLSTTKDVQDAILKDAVRSKAIDVVDIRYWHYQENGTVYAPAGGKSLAPRQQARQLKPKRSSFEQVYRAVREYRDKYPGKAIIYSGDGYDRFGWAAFMAGGSLAAIPEISIEGFLADAATMHPVNLPGNPKDVLALENLGKGYIIYNNSSQAVSLDLNNEKGTFKVWHIDPATGQLLQKEQKLKGGKIVKIENTHSGPAVIWLSRM